MNAPAKKAARFVYVVELLDAATKAWRQHRAARTSTRALELARECRKAGLTVRVRIR